MAEAIVAHCFWTAPSFAVLIFPFDPAVSLDLNQPLTLKSQFLDSPSSAANLGSLTQAALTFGTIIVERCTFETVEM